MKKGKKLLRSVKAHRSLILTLISCAGVLATAGTSAASAIKIHEKIKELRNLNPEISRKDIFKEVWKGGIAPAISVVGTITVILMNEKLNENTKAELLTALAAAGAVTTKKTEDGNEVKELNMLPKAPDEIEYTGNGSVLCYDQFSGRYFYSSPDDVHKAIEIYTKDLEDYGLSSVNEFYELLGMAPSKMGDIFGDVAKNPKRLNLDPEDYLDGNVNLDDPIFDTFFAKSKDGDVFVLARLQEPIEAWYEYEN